MDRRSEGLNDRGAACYLQKQHRVADVVELLPGLLVVPQHLGPLIQSIHDHLHLVCSVLLPLLQCSLHILLLLLQALWHLTLSIYLSPACISDEWTCLALEAWPKRRLCSPNFVPFYPLRNLEAVTAPAEVTRLPQDPCVGAEQG